MDARAILHARRARLVSSGRMRSFLAPCMAVLIGGLAFNGPTGSAHGGPTDGIRICGERDALLEQFAAQHDETPKAFGLGSDGGVIEVLVSPEGGWTMLVTYPARPTCVIAMGEAWETLQLVGKAS